MKDPLVKIFLSVLGAVSLICIAFSGGVYFYSNKSEHTPSQDDSNTIAPVANQSESDTKIYSSDKWHFSIEYPAYLDSISETDKGVAFSDTQNPGPWWEKYSLFIEETSVNSVQDWLNLQPAGETNSTGFSADLFFSTMSGVDGAIVSEYVIADRDVEGNPIYRKGIWAVYVANDLVYRIPLSSSTQFAASEVPTMDALRLNFVFSFRSNF